VGAWRRRSGPLALGQDQRCRRVLERAGPRAPALSAKLSWHISSTGEETGRFSRIGRIARGRSRDNSEASVGIVRMAALARDSRARIWVGERTVLQGTHYHPSLWALTWGYSIPMGVKSARCPCRVCAWQVALVRVTHLCRSDPMEYK
jgi:hypothetical protein